MTFSFWTKIEKSQFYAKLYDFGNGNQGTDSITLLIFEKGF